MAQGDDFLEGGERHLLEIPGLAYPLPLPWVWLPGEERDIRIASLNLIGKTRWNHDLGKLLAVRIRATFPDLGGLCFITVVEKALQLAQVVGSELGVEAMAVAYNRVKPHMEPGRRPVLQVGADSVTSGGKFLAVYERDINLLVAQASRGAILIEDVVTTGGTVLGLLDLLDEVARLKGLPRAIPLLGVFCVAEEGTRTRMFPAPVVSLSRLPDPLVRRPGTLATGARQGRLWPTP